MPSPARKLKSGLACGLALLAFAAEAQPPVREFELIPSGPFTIDEKTGEVVATEGAMITYEDWILTADTIRYNQKTGEAIATGNVVFTREELRLIAEKLVYKPNESFARVENFRAGNGRVYVDGSLLEGDPDNFRFQDVNFYPGEPGTFLFVARAGELALQDGNVVKGKRLFFKVGRVPFLLIPNVTQPLDADTNVFRPKLDYSGHIGGSIGAEALLPVGSDLRLGGNIAITSKRGVLAGPAARYSHVGDTTRYEGAFISGFINDSGELGNDVNGEPIDSDRGFAEWLHKQYWGDNQMSLSTYARYWSDSEVTRDFYDDSFDRMQDPDSYLEANYNGDNWQLSLFTRAALNEFQSHTERLPELRFQYFPTPVAFKGLAHSGFVSAARLDKPANGFEDADTATRLDAFYGVEYNTPLRDGINLRLKAGARGWRYEDAKVYYNYDGGYVTQDATGQKAFGELGADLGMKAFRVFDIKNKTWDIDGIRHIFEPRISYRYTPELEVGDELPSAFISQGFAYDYSVFANYLPPIDIEDRRDIDSITEENKLRIELRNQFQTRAKDGGSRSLASLNFAADYYFEPSLRQEIRPPQYGPLPSGDDFSLLHAELNLTPAPWLEVNALTRLDPEDGLSEKETSARIVFQDPGYWRIGFGAQFLKGGNPERMRIVAGVPMPIPLLDRPFPGYTYSGSDIYQRARLEQYFTFAEYSFSENFKAYAVARYDAQSGVFYDQSIGIMQRALERYGLKYELRIYEGDRREQDFGFTIGIDLFEK